MQFTGNDNDGKPKIGYLYRIAAMDDKELLAEAEQKIWLSAFAANNPRSDYHWHTDALYLECKKREGDLYQKAYDAAARTI